MAAVTPPSVRINTFMKANLKQIDNLSKIFIFLGFLLGLNRIPVIGNVRPFLTKLAFIFNVFYCFYIISLYSNIDSPDNANHMKLCQTLFCCVVGFLAWKRLRSYYDELANFDSKIPQKSKRSWEPVIICLQVIFVSVAVTFIMIQTTMYFFIPVYLMHIFEYNYYGYLFHLLIQRLRLINKCLEFSKPEKDNGKVTNVGMNKLIDFYHVVIKAYYLLIDAIKWQFMVTLIISFIYLLSKAYYIARVYINVTKPFMESMYDIILVLAELIPLLSPCMCCDIIRGEVRHLRELLAFKLYENKLDKSSRRIARAFLSLTETRNLSFSLLRMVDISISLPFTLIGLLVTYLIILLQFQKVITPSNTN